jgi:hypothetical protein
MTPSATPENYTTLTDVTATKTLTMGVDPSLESPQALTLILFSYPV